MLGIAEICSSTTAFRPVVAADLAARGHKVSTMSRYANGTAPVLIRVLGGGAHRGRRGSVLQPFCSRLVSDASAFRSAAVVR